MAPWTHLHTWPDGRTFPCCMTPSDQPIGDLRSDSEFDTLDKIWNSPKYKDMRLKMLKGENIESCNRCYEIESTGHRTLRSDLNENFEHHFDLVNTTQEDGTVEKLNLVYFDFRFSNICNFRCRSCGPELSSAWWEDNKKLFGTPNTEKFIRPFKTADDFYLQVEPLLNSVEEIYFAGGEPLIMDEHYRILKWLDERKKYDVKLKYNTNFSEMRYKGLDVVDLWKKFDTVIVGASLDAEGKRGEYMRKGQNWNQVLENRKRTLEVCPNIHFFISLTLSLMNAYDVVNFHRSWTEKGLINAQDFMVNLLLTPEPLRLQTLPKHHKEKIIELYTEHIKWIHKKATYDGERVASEFQSAINYIEQQDTSQLIPQFERRTRGLDKIRDEDFQTTFPEYEDLY